MFRWCTVHVESLKCVIGSLADLAPGQVPIAYSLNDKIDHNVVV